MNLFSLRDCLYSVGVFFIDLLLYFIVQALAENSSVAFGDNEGVLLSII